MKQAIDFIGNMLGTASALLFVATFFYHTTNDYFFVLGKFRDFSILGWIVMFLLWGVALYDWRKSRYSLLQFMTWMTLVCIVLEFYRFLIFGGDENCRLYIKIVMGLEVVILLLVGYQRYWRLFIYAIATLLITYFGSFVLFPSSIYLSGRILFAVCGIGAILWGLFIICQRKNFTRVATLLKRITLVSLCCGVLFGVLYVYNHLVHGIRFYERPITEAIEKPKVSVVVPVYNAEDTIERALDSLRHQTLKDIEIIAVDDGSTDNTPEILDRYAEFDKRIKVIHQKNAYVGAARNRGMAEAKGEYIGFIDNDDWVSLNYYEELYKEAKRYGAEVVYTNKVWKVIRKFPESKEIFNNGNYPEKGKHLEAIGTGYIWNKLYKLDFLKEHNILFTTRRTPHEDGYFSMQILMYANKIRKITNVAYFLSRYQESASVGQKWAENIDYMLLELYLDLDRLINNADLSEDKKQKFLYFAKNQRDLFFENFYSVLSNDEVKSVFKQLVKETFPDDDVDFDKIDEEAAKKVKVSVIVPVYNEEKTIKRTMESLLNQTLSDMEIIAVDDGSTDNTAEILDEYADKYDYIKVIHQKNAYVGAARNAGRKLARGKYIAFIDADDMVSNDFYKKLYQTAEKYEADIVAAEKVIFVWENKGNLKESYKERAEFTKHDVVEDLASYRQKVDGYVWDKLYRKAFLDKHNIWCTLRRTPAEDNFLTTPALMYADKMYVAKRATFYYHRGSASETSVKHTKLSDEIVEMFQDLDEVIQSSGLGKAKIAKWLHATEVARQRIIRNYYQCLADEDKVVAKKKILQVFPDDAIIFEKGFATEGEQNHLYQQI